MFQGDNTQAFAGNFVKIYAKYITSTGEERPMPPLTKAEIRTGCIVKTYENPVFPLDVNFTEEESIKLNVNNTMTLAVWDAMGRKKTAKGVLKFTAEPRRV
jgi:hypothetical protein